MKSAKLILYTTLFSIIWGTPLLCYGTRMGTLGTCEALSEIKKTGIDVKGFTELERVFSDSNQIAVFFASPREGVCAQCRPHLMIAIFSENNIQGDDTNYSADYQLIKYQDAEDYQADVKPEAQFHNFDLKETKTPILFFTEGGQAGDSGNYFKNFQALAWDGKSLRNVFTHPKEIRNSGNRDESIPEVSMAMLRFEKIEGKPDELVVETISRFYQDETPDKHIKMRRRNIVERFQWSQTPFQFISKSKSIKEDNVLIDEAQYSSLLSGEIPINNSLPTEQLYSPSLTQSNGNRITTASRVRVRTAPSIDASEMALLPLGTLIQELEKSNDKQQVNQSEDYWYRIAAPSDLKGWVFGGLIAPFDPARREEIYQKIASDQMKVTKTTFEDQLDLVDFLKRAATEVKKPEIAADLEFKYLLALRQALELIPSDQREKPPFPSWLEAQAKQHVIFYSEPSGSWIVNSDQFWELHKKYQALPIGDQIAYEAARNPVGGECEASLLCRLSVITLTQNKYLEFYPKSGAHTEEMLTAIADFLKDAVANYADFDIMKSEHADILGQIKEIRATVMKTSSQQKTIILQRLDQLVSQPLLKKGR